MTKRCGRRYDRAANFAQLIDSSSVLLVNRVNLHEKDDDPLHYFSRVVVSEVYV
jgi:hypothetical protein